MNANDVWTATAALVSDNRIENAAAFYASLNRALDEIASLSPLLTLVSLEHPGQSGTGVSSPDGSGEAYTFYKADDLAGDKRLLFDDALALTKDGKPLSEETGRVPPVFCRSEGVYLASDAPGLYRFLLPRMPDVVWEGNRDEDLTLRAILVPLVPLLCAYYYSVAEHLDGGEALLARYQALLSTLRRRLPPPGDPAEGKQTGSATAGGACSEAVENVTGW